MGFRINTNVAAMGAHNYGVMNNRELDSSLGRLSSGLRINSAADDAAGMAIADSLKSQGSALGQSIKNANDAVGILQTADKAMDEQIKILDTIKTKATQAAADGQSTLSRQAIQNDIVRLMEELDNIATTTSFNGMSLLSGSFINKEFQIGAYSNQTVRASIGATSSDKIGSTRFETTTTITAPTNGALKFTNPDGTFTQIQSVVISHSASTGLGALAEAVNRSSDATGVRASYKVVTTGLNAVKAGDVENLRINGITIGDVLDVKDSDANGNLVNAINVVTHQTGAYASLDVSGKLVLTSTDGRGIKVETASTPTIANAEENNPTMSGLDNVLQIKMFDLQGIQAPTAGPTSAGFTINGVLVGAIDPTNVANINAFTDRTGVTASRGVGADLIAGTPDDPLVLSGDERGVSLTSTTAVGANADTAILGMTVGISKTAISGAAAGPAATDLSAGFSINGITIGAMGNVGPTNAQTAAHINAFTSRTGVTASVDDAFGTITGTPGALILTSSDGRLNISSTATIAPATTAGANAVQDAAVLGITRADTAIAAVASGLISGYTVVHNPNQNYGRLTLVGHGSRDIVVTDANAAAGAGLNANLNAISNGAAIANLRDVRGNFLSTVGLAAGAYANRAESGAAVKVMGSGVTTRTGAMMVMDIAESAMKMLDRIRADIGSVQNQIVSTINNISVTKVNVAQAESNIRDVDFAEESANFSKRNLLSQSGSFAMAQANTIQQNVMKLLQ